MLFVRVDVLCGSLTNRKIDKINNELACYVFTSRVLGADDHNLQSHKIDIGSDTASVSEAVVRGQPRVRAPACH